MFRVNVTQAVDRETNPRVRGSAGSAGVRGNDRGGLAGWILAVTPGDHEHPLMARINVHSAGELVDSRHFSPITAIFVRADEVDPRRRGACGWR